MQIDIEHTTRKCVGTINITGSKSESNRLLVLQALFPNLLIENCSNSDDSELMKTALKSEDEYIDVNHAGTAMRFLTTYFAIQEGRKTILTGSQRMQERPIKALVDALVQLGAEISYEKKEGFPPLRILGKKLASKTVVLPADISSQYISALMLIGAVLPDGITLNLIGKIASIPYIRMTQALLERVGISSLFEGNKVIIRPAAKIANSIQVVESDWSSASYYYSIAALAEKSEIRLNNYRKDSLQGDAQLQEIYKKLGIRSRFEKETIVLNKIHDFALPKSISLNLSAAPDIAQTIAVSCYGLGVECHLTGLHTLRIKETDRLEAMRTELKKVGAKVDATADSLHLFSCSNFQKKCTVATYDDHRMAMAFAPLALKVPLQIQDAEVVSKSYPEFWNDLQLIDFKINKF